MDQSRKEAIEKAALSCAESCEGLTIGFMPEQFTDAGHWRCIEAIRELSGYVRSLVQINAHPLSSWVDVREKPLCRMLTPEDEAYQPGYWEANINCDFLAAVEYNDSTMPGRTFWWMRLCYLDESGLKQVSDEDCEDTGWRWEDVTYYMPIQPPQNKA